MAVQDIKDSQTLRKQGARLGRAGLSERVNVLVAEYLANQSPKNAIALAGRLRAVALAARADGYWSEKCSEGFTREIRNLSQCGSDGKLPDNKPSWWVD